MSSTYRRICLSHDPPLVIDEDYKGEPGDEVVGKPEGHPDCVIGIGRFSYPLIEIWLPIPYTDASGPHKGKWYDVSWMREFTRVVTAIANDRL